MAFTQTHSVFVGGKLAGFNKPREYCRGCACKIEPGKVRCSLCNSLRLYNRSLCEGKGYSGIDREADLDFLDKFEFGVTAAIADGKISGLKGLELYEKAARIRRKIRNLLGMLAASHSADEDFKANKGTLRPQATHGK